MKDAFSTYHPVVNFIYFTLVLVLSLIHIFMSGENVWTALFAVAGLIFAIAGIDGVAQTKKSSEEKDKPALDEQPKE